MSQFWKDKEERGEGDHRVPEQKESQGEREYFPGPLQCQVGLFVVGEVAWGKIVNPLKFMLEKSLEIEY